MEELRTLLRGNNLNPPYILVGHSLGGLYMQLFARRYPDEVAGIAVLPIAAWDFSLGLYLIFWGFHLSPSPPGSHDAA